MLSLVEIDKRDVGPGVRIADAGERRNGTTSVLALAPIHNRSHSLIPIQIANNVLSGVQGASAGGCAKYCLNVNLVCIARKSVSPAFLWNTDSTAT
jgi:hypothetical protein